MSALLAIAALTLQILSGILAGGLIAILLGCIITCHTLWGILYLIPIALVGAVWFWFSDLLESWR